MYNMLSESVSHEKNKTQLFLHHAVEVSGSCAYAFGYAYTHTQSTNVNRIHVGCSIYETIQPINS